MLKYQELANRLLEKIIKGAFPNGKLPSMQNLSTEYSVSLQTAQSAIKTLEKQGVVSCMPGNVGTRVNQARAEMLRQTEALQVEFDKGLPATQTTLHFAYTENLWTHVIPSLVEDFQKRYPWINIEPICVRDIYTLDELSGNQEIDVLIINSRDIPYFARKELLRRLPENPSFLSGINKGNYYQNHCYGLTVSWALPVLRTNGTLSGAVDPQDMDKTFSSILKVGKRENITLDIGFYSLMYYFLGDLKGRVLSSDDDLGIQKTIEILARFCHNNSSHYLWHNRNFAESDNCMKFEYITSASGSIADYDLYDYTVTFSNLRKVPLTTAVLAIPTKSRCPQEGYLWCNYLLQEKIQRRLSEIYGFLSPIQSVYQECCPDKLRAELNAALLQAETVGMSSRGLFMFYSSIFPLLEEYFEDRSSLESTATEIRKIFNEINYVQAQF